MRGLVNFLTLFRSYTGDERRHRVDIVGICWSGPVRAHGSAETTFVPLASGCFATRFGLL